jgi:hypothetical protein
MREMETPSPARVIMSILGHVAIGVATARLVAPPGKPSYVLRTRMVVLTALALLPDLDFLAHPGVESRRSRGGLGGKVFTERWRSSDRQL